MRLIDTEEAAKRLARVILSDIEIYNRQQVRAQADLKPQLDEGYALFRSRVAPELVPVFSEVVADRWSGAAKPATGARGPTPTKAAAVEPRPPAPPPLPAARPPAPPEPVAARPAAVPASRRESLDPREAARRLARVMASSIPTGDRPDGGAGLAADIDEARALFRSCVLPDLAPLFDDAIAELGLLEQAPPSARPVPAPTPPVPAPAPPVLVSPYESTQAVPSPSTTNDLTDQTTAPLFEEPSTPPTPPVAAPPEPDEDLPTVPLPAATSRPPSLPGRAPARIWLAVTAAAVAAATAGVVYLLLT